MQPLRAFIVEDSPVILDNLVATLEELAQVEVVGAAAEEREALRWIEAPPKAFDLMIIDIFLKSGSGLGVLRAAQEAALPARRVVLTNFANPDIRKRCAELGADRVFDKSSELEDLINYCSSVADGSSTVLPGVSR
jgi:DNA-binding NarL/FixJ family response regulator